MSLLFIDIRVIRDSILAHVRSHFLDPPTAMPWSRALNVYGIVQMLDVTFTPTEPFVFVIAAHAEPTPTRIPMVVIDPIIRLVSPQLGSRGGAEISLQLHCWGRTRAERDDIATMLANVYAGKTGRTSSIPIWTSLSDTTTAGTAQVTSTVAVSFPTAGDSLSAEGTLRNWTVVSFNLTIK